jgi:hypothetical protein
VESKQTATAGVSEILIICVCNYFGYRTLDGHPAWDTGKFEGIEAARGKISGLPQIQAVVTTTINQAETLTAALLPQPKNKPRIQDNPFQIRR